jgi:hypothetical protein
MRRGAASDDERSSYRLAAIALGWVVAARFSLRFSARPVRKVELLLMRAAARLPMPGDWQVEDAARAITAAARRVPGTRCLAWSLALRALLAQMGIASTLRLGVARSGAAGLDAHAWVHCQGRDWGWGATSIESYQVLEPS